MVAPYCASWTDRVYITCATLHFSLSLSIPRSRRLDGFQLSTAGFADRRMPTVYVASIVVEQRLGCCAAIPLAHLPTLAKRIAALQLLLLSAHTKRNRVRHKIAHVYTTCATGASSHKIARKKMWNSNYLYKSNWYEFTKGVVKTTIRRNIVSVRIGNLLTSESTLRPHVSLNDSSPKRQSMIPPVCSTRCSFGSTQVDYMSATYSAI